MASILEKLIVLGGTTTHGYTRIYESLLREKRREKRCQESGSASAASSAVGPVAVEVAACANFGVQTSTDQRCFELPPQARVSINTVVILNNNKYPLEIPILG